MLPVIDGFDIVRELGRGGMGIAFEATRRGDDRRVALKMILSQKDPSLEQLARFRVEAEAAACLDHPNIVKLFGCQLWRGCPVLVFEYLGGGNLSDRIAGKPRTAKWAAKVTLQLAQAVQHAHSRGILHRDLKPANVLMTEEELPKISDFGLAKFIRPIAQVSEEFCATLGQANEWDAELLSIHRRYRQVNNKQAFFDFVVDSTIEQYKLGLPSSTLTQLSADVRRFAAECARFDRSSSEIMPLLNSLTRDGGVLGSPQYMSPEQAAGRTGSYGPPTDVYGLGAVLYAMVTGHPPFIGDRLSLVLHRVQVERPLPFGSSVDSRLAEICLRCLEKDPGARYSSAESLARALQDFLDHYSDLRTEQRNRPEFATIHRFPSLPSTLAEGVAMTNFMLCGCGHQIDTANKRPGEMVVCPGCGAKVVCPGVFAHVHLHDGRISPKRAGALSNRTEPTGWFRRFLRRVGLV